MMKYLIFLFFLLNIPSQLLAEENTIKPFTTDGCSVFPDGTSKQKALWMQCCIRHDFSYWKGGTAEQRKLADSNLEMCVADLGEKNTSLIMLTGVRLGGSPFYPTWYRWGYGWPYMRGYKPLNDNENIQIVEQLDTLSLLLDELIAEMQ